MAELHLTWRVRGVLRLYDSFTARAANLSAFRVMVRTPEGVSMVRKPDGILVFIGSGPAAGASGPLEIRLESEVFFPVSVTLAEASRQRPHIVWLRPNARYPAPALSSKLYGRVQPRAGLRFVFTGGGTLMKLLTELKEERGLAEIYHPGKNSLEGQMLELRHEGRRDWLALEEQAGSPGPQTGLYTYSGIQKGHVYPRLETSLQPVYSTEADGEGNYTLFFRETPKARSAGRLYIRAGERETELAAEILRGESLRLDGI